MVARCQRLWLSGRLDGGTLRSRRAADPSASLGMTEGGGIELFQFLVAALGSVAGLAAIAFGHPNGLDALPVGEGQQVADSSVDRDKLLLDARQANRKSRLAQALPESLR